MPRPWRGRESRSSSAALNVAKTAVQTVCFWTFFLLIMPLAILSIENLLELQSWRFGSPSVHRAGVVLFIVAGSLGLWSGFTMAVHGRGTPVPFDCPPALVTAGPYGYIRNPMVVAGLAQGIAVGLMTGSWFIIGYALAGAPVWQWFVRPGEEYDLRARLGRPYDTYCANVQCWCPRLTRWRAAGHTNDLSSSPRSASRRG